VRRYGLVGSAFGDEGCQLADEVLKVAEGLEPVGDDVVVDPDVLVNQDVTEADRLTDRARECRSAGVQTPCSPSSLTASPLSAGGPQPSVAQMCWATSTHASMAVTNVYLTPPQPDGILTAALIGACLMAEHRDVVGDAAQQPQDPDLVDHGYLALALAVTAAANSWWERAIRGNSSK
jgi:hypothetical protein